MSAGDHQDPQKAALGGRHGAVPIPLPGAGPLAGPTAQSRSAAVRFAQSTWPVGAGAPHSASTRGMHGPPRATRARKRVADRKFHVGQRAYDDVVLTRALWGDGHLRPTWRSRRRATRRGTCGKAAHRKRHPLRSGCTPGARARTETLGVHLNTQSVMATEARRGSFAELMAGVEPGLEGIARDLRALIFQVHPEAVGVVRLGDRAASFRGRPTPGAAPPRRGRTSGAAACAREFPRDRTPGIGSLAQRPGTGRAVGARCAPTVAAELIGRSCESPCLHSPAEHSRDLAMAGQRATRRA